ncbi:hypothetical protein [Winogradskyella sp. A2]|uniref:hypothetical protein n=1 Tax=Winogradskyella sp. A2 TaxID=3366944 RepID=UPI00398C42B4
MNPIIKTIRTTILSLCVLLVASEIEAQSYENLNRLEGNYLDTYYSEDTYEQAVHMAKLCDSVMSFYNALIGFKPSVSLLVLSPADWSNYTKFPVYGMPHYPNSKTLVVASDDNDFWNSMLPSLEKLPKEIAHAISNTYSDDSGNLTMRGFFDLLAIHELGHTFHEQGGLTTQRKWMGELFANIFLHTYIAEKEPTLLPALTTFPKMVVSSTDPGQLKYSTLSELENNYDLITQQYPQNYGWYQCKWHIGAANIYDEGGVGTFQKLWDVLKSNNEPLNNLSFATLLSNKVHKSVADVQLKWNK